MPQMRKVRAREEGLWGKKYQWLFQFTGYQVPQMWKIWTYRARLTREAEQASRQDRLSGKKRLLRLRVERSLRLVRAVRPLSSMRANTLLSLLLIQDAETDRRFPPLLIWLFEILEENFDIFVYYFVPKTLSDSIFCAGHFSRENEFLDQRPTDCRHKK